MRAEPLTACVHVAAPPERVFRFFTDAEAMMRWMGEWALLEARVGGQFQVDVRGVPVRGRYLQIEAPHRLLISWGHAGSERLPVGASTLEVRLRAEAGGTRVEIIHSGLPEPEADGYARGWRHFISRLAVAAARQRRVCGAAESIPAADM